MTEERLNPSSKRRSARSLDLDISASLIVERLVGEILGWDLVDWSAIEPHRGRRFFFGRQHQSAPSIHDLLKPLFDRCDPAWNDFSAVGPSPIVNTNLNKLVGCLCRHLGKHHLPVPETDGMALARTAEQDRLHLTAIERLVGRINDNPILSERSDRLKRIAAAAENELEKHIVDVINRRLEASFLPDGMLDAYKVGRLRDQAKGRVGEARLLNARELNGLAMPELALDDEALIRVEMTKILLSRFPYVRNYELMLLAEIAALQRPLTPLFLRERALSGKGGQIDRALIERWGKAVAGISSVTGEPDAHRWQGALTDRTIAICGSGPLPMSALFLHLFTGAAVVLIDMERTAVVRSQRLITNLERLGILKPGVLAVRRVNAADVSFHHPNRLSGNMADTSVTCDAVMVASLVDHNAKTSIATQLCVDHGAPKLLIMRSATGLSAQLAYDPVPAEGFNRGNLVYCGETMPATQIAVHLDRIEAIRRGVACKESPDLLAIAHPDVVNTTEIYRKIATYPESFQLDFSACETVEDWIRELEIAGARLGAAEPKNRMG